MLILKQIQGEKNLKNLICDHFVKKILNIK